MPDHRNQCVGFGTLHARTQTFYTYARNTSAKPPKQKQSWMTRIGTRTHSWLQTNKERKKQYQIISKWSIEWWKSLTTFDRWKELSKFCVSLTTMMRCASKQMQKHTAIDVNQKENCSGFFIFFFHFVRARIKQKREARWQIQSQRETKHRAALHKRFCGAFFRLA